MGKLEDDIVSHMPFSAKGQEVEDERLALFIPIAQGLSEKLMPHKYLAHYEWLLANDPTKAKAYFDICAISIPEPKTIDPFALEKKALAKLDETTKIVKPLRRRV